MENNVETSVVAIIAMQASVSTETISATTKLEAIGLDSLGMVEVIFALEEAFDISIPFNANEAGNDNFDLSSVGDVVASVENLVSEAVK